MAAVRNEAVQIEAWLASVAFAPRVVVIDQGSQDGTRAILESAAADPGLPSVTVLDGPDTLSIEDLRQRAIEPVTQGWILVLDVDERIPLALRDELVETLGSAPAEAGFRIPFRHYVFGRWLRHGGWNDAHLRLFRAGTGGYVAGRIHAQPEITGTIGQLSEAVVHFAHPTIHDFLVKMNRYTRQSAETLAAGEAGGLRRRPALPARRVAWLRASAGVFWNRYVKARGFRDGTAGFVVATLLAAYQFVEQAKAWEAREGVGS